MKKEFNADITYFDQSGKEHSCRISKDDPAWKFQNGLAVNETLGFQIRYLLLPDRLTIFTSSCFESGKCRLKTITPMPELISGGEGEQKKLVIPYGSGALIRTQGKSCKETLIGGFFPYGAVGLMSCYAVTDEKNSSLVIVDDGRYDMQFRLRTAWGDEKRYSVAGTFFLRDDVADDLLKDNITLHFYDLPGGLPAIAGCYRDFLCGRNNIRLLAERAENEPLIEYCSRAIVMRMRLACKEMPSPILEQTPDHQPKLNVYMTFDHAREVLQECARQNVGALDCCLVGWNNGGHDGSYPQIFPVETRLGGEAALQTCIGEAKKLGYRIGLHDNYFDSYTVANNFSWDKVQRTYQQLPALSGIWGGGQSYIVCPRKSYENAQHNMPLSRELGTNGLYFTDVLTVWPLEKCYSKSHPLSRKECAFWRKMIVKLAHDTFGGTMCEGGQDWAFPELDRVYDMIDTPDMPEWCDEEYPLYQMVFHGRIIYNTYRGGINSWPGEAIYLRNLAFGGMPTVYWHYIFHPAQTAEGGQDPERDLRYSPQTLTKEVARIKAITDDVRRLEKIRFAMMTDYVEHTPDVTETRYDNGCSVFVNYGEQTAECCGVTIPAKDFTVK